MSTNFKIKIFEDWFDLQYLEIDHREEQLPVVTFALDALLTPTQTATLFSCTDGIFTEITTGQIALTADRVSSIAHLTTYHLQYSPTFPTDILLDSTIETKEPHKFYFISRSMVMNYSLINATVYSSVLLSTTQTRDTITDQQCLRYHIQRLSRTHRDLRAKISIPWEYTHNEHIDLGLLLSEAFNDRYPLPDSDTTTWSTTMGAVRAAIISTSDTHTDLMRYKANRAFPTFACAPLLNLLRTYRPPYAKILRTDSQILGIANDQGCGIVCADLIFECNHRTNVDETCQFTVTNPLKSAESNVVPDNLLVRINPAITTHAHWHANHDYRIDDQVVANRVLYRCISAHRSSRYAFADDHQAESSPWEKIDTSLNPPDWYLTSPQGTQTLQTIANYAAGLVLRNARTCKIDLRIPVESALAYHLGDTLEIQLKDQTYRGLISRLKLKCAATYHTCTISVLCLENQLLARTPTDISDNIVTVEIVDQPDPDPFSADIMIVRKLINAETIDATEHIDLRLPEYPNFIKRYHRANCHWQLF
jgi:hypothetical protein